MKILICSFIMFLVLCVPVLAGSRPAGTYPVPGGIIYCFQSDKFQDTISCVFVPSQK